MIREARGRKGQLTAFEARAKVAVHILQPTVLVQQALQAIQFIGIGSRRNAQFAFHDIESIGRDPCMKGRMPLQLRDSVSADKIRDSFHKFFRSRLILHLSLLRRAAPEGAASQFRFRKSGGRWLRVRPSGPCRSGTRSP